MFEGGENVGASTPGRVRGWNSGLAGRVSEDKGSKGPGRAGRLHWGEGGERAFVFNDYTHDARYYNTRVRVPRSRWFSSGVPVCIRIAKTVFSFFLLLHSHHWRLDPSLLYGGAFGGSVVLLGMGISR